MVISCAAFNCKSRHEKGCKLSFHRFPTDPVLRKSWIIATKRDNYNPSKFAVLCNKHFKSEDYVHNFGLTKLRNGTVPTIFDFPPHLVKNIKERTTKTSQGLLEKENLENARPIPNDPINDNPQIKLEVTDVSSVVQNSCTNDNQKMQNFEPPTIPSYVVNACPIITTKRKRSVQVYLGDFDIEDMNCPKKAKLMFQIAKKTVLLKNKQIKYLTNRTAKLNKRILSMEAEISHLKSANKISKTQKLTAHTTTTQ